MKNDLKQLIKNNLRQLIIAGAILVGSFMIARVFYQISLALDAIAGKIVYGI